MLKSHLSGTDWRLETETGLLLKHTKQRPFATAIRREKTYTASRGTVKTTVTEAERIPLDAVSAEGDHAVVLSGGGQSLRVAFSECSGRANSSKRGVKGKACCQACL